MVILCKIKLIFQVCVDADYRLEIRVFSYNNPTHRCARCGPQQPCCDGNRTESCSGPEQCDNYFVFCLRPLGTSGFDNQFCPLGRYSTALNSVLNDQDSFVFEEGEQTLLHLSNPLVFTGPRWLVSRFLAPIQCTTCTFTSMAITICIPHMYREEFNCLL